jgi:GNAT superfamily N-acetyltransferase
MVAAPIRVGTLAADDFEMAIPGLAALIVDAVRGGAAVNFTAGVTHDEAAAWWRARRAEVADGTITVLLARAAAEDPEDDGAIVGSTILIRSRNANSPHRAEVGKVLVHRSARRRGLGGALMAAAEARARADGRWLLILTTEAGSPADAFYRSLGWRELGTMPNHAYRADGTLASTTYFWKDLRDEPPAVDAERVARDTEPTAGRPESRRRSRRITITH